MKITEAELQERRERIIEMAFGRFCEHGIEKVTLSDIAKASRVGDSTIYRYFGTKPKLVSYTLNTLWRTVSLEIEEAIEKTEGFDRMNGFQQTEVRLNTLCNLYEIHAKYVLFSYEAKLYLQRSGEQYTVGMIDHMMEEIKGPSIASLKKGVKDGSIRLWADEEDVFYAVWGCVRGYIGKIVVYSGLCMNQDPWKSRYGLVVNGMLRLLKNTDSPTPGTV